MLHFFSRLLFPPTCKGCGKRFPLTPTNSLPPVFCAACEAAWQKAMREECPRCFCPRFSCTCQRPSMKRAGFSLHVKLARYSEAPADRVMHRVVLYMKTHVCARLADRCADELKGGVAEAINALGYDVDHALIVPLPRAVKRVRRYGVDQAVVLAEALARATGIPSQPLLYRTRRARVQKELNGTDRFQNLKEAFTSHRVPKGCCVLLLDDVVTTGASMCAAGKALMAAGACDVIAVSLANTEKKRNSA